jgi:hypothetical protein
VLVSRSEFFDGNDDLGSIGCNLGNHPGTEAFDAAFRAIEALPGVSGVYFGINELLDEDGSWPFSDTAYIVTSQPPATFRQILAPLQPDSIEVQTEQFANPPAVPAGHSLVLVWWD